MRKAFERRVLAEDWLDLIRACQTEVSCHLGGGAALSGAFLAHRLTGDVDLFCHVHEDFLALRGIVAARCDARGIACKLVRDAPNFARFHLMSGGRALEFDVVEDLVPDVEPCPQPIEGVVVESLADLRANKLTCLVSRAEPRDLVDLLFLDRAGFSPENDLGLALQKDAGIDPGILSWLLSSFPVRPLPAMLLPLREGELLAFRDDLSARFRRLATTPE